MGFTSIRQTDKLKTYLIAVGYIPSVAAAGISDATMDSAINSQLANFEDGFGDDLQDTDGGNSSTPGLFTEDHGPVLNRGYVRALTPDGYPIHCYTSRRRYSSGLSNVTGLDIIFVAGTAPADASSNEIEFSSATNKVRWNISGSTSIWSTDLSALSDGDYFIMRYITAGGLPGTIIAQRNSSALPGSDQTDTLTIIDGQWAWGTFYFDPGVNNIIPVEVDTNYHYFCSRVIAHIGTEEAGTNAGDKSLSLTLPRPTRRQVECDVTTVSVATFDALPDHDILHITRSTTGVCAIAFKDSCKVSGKVYWFKDAGFNCNTNNITITPESGQIESAGALAASYTMNTDGEAVGFYTDGTDWYQVT